MRSYLDFKDAFVERADEAPVKGHDPEERAMWQWLRLVRFVRSDFGTPRAVEKRADTPFDFVALADGTLYLYIVDRELFERDEEVVGRRDFKEALARLDFYVRSAVGVGVRQTGDEVDRIVFALLREIAEGREQDVRRVAACILTLNPLREGSDQPKTVHIGPLALDVFCWSPVKYWTPGNHDAWLEAVRGMDADGRIAAAPASERDEPEVAPGASVPVAPRPASPVLRPMPPSASPAPPPPSRGGRNSPRMTRRLANAWETSRTAETPGSRANPVAAPAPAARAEEAICKEAVDELQTIVDWMGAHPGLDPVEHFGGPCTEKAASHEGEAVVSADADRPTVAPPVEPAPAVTIERNPDRNAEEFRERLLGELAGETFLHYALFDRLVEILLDTGRYEEILPASQFEKGLRGRRIALDGYSFDETNGVLSLFLLDDETRGSFTKTDVAAKGTLLHNFFEGSCRGELLDERDGVLDINTDAGWCSEQIGRMWKDDITRVEYVILTMRGNDMRRGSLLPEGTFESIPWSVRLFDYRTLFEFDRKGEKPFVDFERIAPGDAIGLLPAVEGKGYSAYVGRIAAQTIVDIYDEFGQRVLAGNVRAFLQATNKVNKGMLETIRTTPEKFFAYNNGLCLVAEHIDVKHKGELAILKSALDFQIVNGGQTTATLHYARTKRNCSLKGIYVQVKLSVLPEGMSDEDRLRFVKEISEYANSQSKVSDSDLGANTTFQIKFQTVSKHADCLTFDAAGRPQAWFYERSRGSYNVEKAKAGKTFLTRYPYDKKFDKLQLAKWISAWAGEPHVVSKGAQKCYVAFSREIAAREAKDPSLSFVTPAYVKFCIGKGVLFKHLDALVGNADWYKAERSYKANIVAYGTALLAQLVREHFGPTKTLDFERLFEEGRVPAAFDAMLLRLARCARRVFDDPNRDNSDVGEWVKKENCWRMLCERGEALSTDEAELLAPWVIEAPREFEPESIAAGAASEAAG